MRIKSVVSMAILCAVFNAVAAEAPVKAEAGSNSGGEEDFFAIVGGEVVPVSEFAARLRANSRNRFYHGKVPEEEVEKFKRDIADKLVDRVLLLQEAKRLKLQPEKEAVDTRLAQIDAGRSKDEDWQKNKERLWPGITKELEGDDLLAQLEKKIRDVAEPKADAVAAYYKANGDKFTAPERIKVSLVMLKVDPSAPSALWEAAFEEASALVAKLRNGADFAEMARIHSSDESAVNGGDMGYIHKGMLAVPAQNILNMMSPKEISEPVVLLQGVAIFRLDDRVEARLNPLDKVKDRAAALLKRDLAEQAWTDLIKKLRDQTKIELNAEYIKPKQGAS